MVFRRLYDEKLKIGEILLQTDGAANVHESSFPKHPRGKGYVMMASRSEVAAGKVVPDGTKLIQI